MIDHATRLEGFDARSWHRLVTLVIPGLDSRPPHAWSFPSTEPGGALLVLRDGDVILRAVHTHRGSIAAERWEGPSTLARLAAECDCRFALAVQRGAVATLLDRIGGRLAPDDDPFTTLTVILGAARELLDDGSFTTLPAVPASVPLPPTEVIRGAWDHLLPDGSSALIALFHDHRLDTAIAARRRGVALDRVYGPESVAGWTGPLSGDHRRDARVLRRAVADHLGPLAFGIYAPTETFAAIVRGESAGGLARAVASREVMIDPMPPWLGVAAGASALRVAAESSRAWAEGLEAAGLPLPRSIRRVAERLAAAELGGASGFDPLAIIARLLRQSTARRGRDEPDER